MNKFERNKTAFTPKEMLLYLQENVRIDEGCRLWGGPFQPGGQTKITWRRKVRSAQGLLLELLGRTEPGQRYSTWAICANRTCMNPAHLRHGSHGAAIRNAVARGDYPNSNRRSQIQLLANAKRSKLPVTERHAVAQMLLEGKTIAEIGAHYGISQTRVYAARKAWARAGFGEHQ